MAPQGFLVVRNEGNSNGISHVAIAGFCVAGAVGLATIVWLGFRLYKKRVQTHRDQALDSASLNVRGLVNDAKSDEKSTEPLPADIQAIQGHTFSRAQSTAIVMPDRALVRPNVTREDIVEHHTQAGNLPRPFTPFSFALAAGGRGGSQPPQTGRSSTVSFTTTTRDSFLSAFSGSSRFSAISTVSSLGQTTKRKVRQLFEPVLPDELVLSMGEGVTVMQSFDDGWCVVGRSSLMKPGDIELGTAPTWCFLKPVKGLRAERPMRITSLGITVQLNQPNHSAREDVISWSNF